MAEKKGNLRALELSEINIQENALAHYRQSFEPSLCDMFAHLSQVVGHKAFSLKQDPAIAQIFDALDCSSMCFSLSLEKRACKPLKVGILLSGGPAPGGHNVIAGLLDGLLQLHPQSSLIGFHGGSLGLIEDRWSAITQESIKNFRHMGGFDLLGSGRTKIETAQQFESARKSVCALGLDGLVVVGGDDSNTNAALLAQDFARHHISCSVVGTPKTIDGDMKGGGIEISFGFDTACRVYSEMIGHLARDCLSTRKYYHFIRLMGRSASHITLECALQTRPTWALIGEQLKKEKKTLKEITEQIAHVMIERYKKGIFHGVILVPEGLVEFIPEFSTLIEELNAALAKEPSLSCEEVVFLLDKSKQTFQSLPKVIQEQLLLERDPHGNVQVSRIETEKLLMEMVDRLLKERMIEISCLNHFLGYEARAAMPTDFDATYTYALGLTAALLVRDNAMGYIAFIEGLHLDSTKWKPRAVALTSLIHKEIRSGKTKPVIAKALVELDSPAFQYFESKRAVWSNHDCFRFVGPIQYAGPSSIRGKGPLTLHLNAGSFDSSYL